MRIDNSVDYCVERGVGDEVCKCVDAGVRLSKLESNLWVNV